MEDNAHDLESQGVVTPSKRVQESPVAVEEAVDNEAWQVGVNVLLSIFGCSWILTNSHQNGLRLRKNKYNWHAAH